MPTKRPGRPRADVARDLRSLLLKTSRELLDEAGPGALSMREVARRAGCTHQAPYHYFEDRESILAALVTEGFDELARRLAAANDLARTEGVRAALLASGSAYIDFALSHPGVFRIMFRPDVCDPRRFPSLQQAGARAHAELERLVQIVHGTQASATLGSIYWAHVHGLACLIIDGPLALRLPSPRARRAHLRQVGARFADLMIGRAT
ncbi:MAG TPA: TetR/AcrR family transcriptional regulator [Planctomycetaceae bacterium]|nr:TetR/AcrR family transcriptional regulator [Planctomycetaceae bacterium]